MKKDISIEQTATHFDVLSAKIDNTNERIRHLEERLFSKINTLQWIDELLTIGIFYRLFLHYGNQEITCSQYYDMM